MIPGVFLALLSAVWGYTLFEYGGVVRRERLISLCALGLVSLAYWILMRRKTAPPLTGSLRWASRLLLLYVALQLVPLPLRLLQILSPARVELIRAFDGVGNADQFAALSVVPEAAMKHVLLICGYMLVFSLVRDFSWQLPERRWLLAAPLIGAGILEAAVGLMQAASGPNASGTFANRDHYSALLEMALPFALMYPVSIWRGVDQRRDFPAPQAVKMCALLGTSALIILGIISSLSRMGFIAALLSLMATGAILQVGGNTSTGRKWLLSITLLAAGLLFCFIFLPSDAFIGRFAQFKTVEGISREGRLQLWSESLRLFRAFPVFGCGLGGFESVFMRYKVSDPMITDAFVHNDYLQFLIELGAVGFAIGAVLFSSLARALVHVLRDGRKSDARYVAAACFGAFTAIGVHSFVDFSLYVPANAMLLAWISGICAGLDITFVKHGNESHIELQQ